MYFGRFGWDDTVDVFDFFIKDARGTDPWGITWEVHPDIPSIGTPAQTLAECKRLEKWRTPHGGLIIASYNYDTPEQNERVVFDYFREGKHPEDDEHFA
jgi:hypothetical protein